MSDTNGDSGPSGVPRVIEGPAAALADGGQHRPRVDLFLGVACNNDCVFCTEGGRRGPRRTYSLAEAEGLLARTEGLTTVFLTGGEPTLNRDLLAFAALVRARGVPHVALITNGRKLSDRALAEGLLARGVNEIRISIHGHTAALHDAHSRVGGSFDEVRRGLANLRTLRAHGAFQLLVLVVVTRANLPHLRAIYDWARTEGADRVGFGIVRPSGLAATHFDEVIPRYADVGAAFRAFLGGLRLREDPVNVDSLPPCLAPDELAFVGARMRLVSLDEADRLVERDEYWEKRKGPPCAACLLRSSCEGVWEGYVERFGWDEFTPVVSPPGGPLEAGRCVASWGDPDAAAHPLLSLGAACNCGCLGCPLPRGEGTEEVDPLARLERLARAGADGVRVGGGEPTLAPALPAVLARAAALGVRATLATNARLLAYPQLVRRLAGAAPARLVTFFLGHDAVRHDAATRAPGSFEQTLAGVRNARRAGWPVDVLLDAGAGPSEPYDALRRALASLGCRTLPVRRSSAGEPLVSSVSRL